MAAHDLASALAFLHSRRIIHRDLKSDNIGFDIRGDIKIFDFGLARELPPAEQANLHGAWKMTGATGTPRYMSPEVALEQPYNESCDSYSFCMLLWEILALKTPFELYGMKTFKERVWRGPHKRPPLDPAWPRSLHGLFNRGWSPVLSERQPMATVTEMLRNEVIRSREDVDEEWGLNVEDERRSTHIWDPNDLKNLENSHRSLFSLISSPFHAKSPFRMGHTGSPSKTPRKLVLSPELVKPGIDHSAAPTEVDLSGSNDSSAPGRVPSLPTKPPLLDDSESEIDVLEDSHSDRGSVAPSDEADEEDSTSPTAEKLLQPPNPLAAAIWERIEQEKARRQQIRMRLSAVQAAQ